MKWLDSGVIVDPNQRLLILGEGQVDLWPQGPGQYMTGPKGYSTAGKGGTFMAGALIAKVGEHGKAFFVGERYEGKHALLLCPGLFFSTGSPFVHTGRCTNLPASSIRRQV